MIGERYRAGRRRDRSGSFALFLVISMGLIIPRAAAAQAGNTVDVGGHRLYCEVSGRGRPTVVIDVGVGESFQSWSSLVAGLVLLDPPPRGWLAGEAFPGLKQMFLRVTGDMSRATAAAEQSGSENDRRDAPFLRTVASEHEEMFGSSARDVLAASSFGDLRLIVIASGRTNPLFGEEAEAYQKYWIEESRKLAGLSSAGEFVLAGESGHQIHRDAPGLVLAAIRKLLSASTPRPEFSPRNRMAAASLMPGRE